MKPFAVRSRFDSHLLLFAVLATLSLAQMAPHRASAQQQPAVARQAQVINAAASETPKSEEEQEQAFMNSANVHKAADLMHLPEPVARVLLMTLNFAIIFFAIIIPLTKLMPRIFRKRSQTLRSSLDLARQATEEARQRLSGVEAKLAGLGDEIARFRAQVEQESLQDEQRIKAALQEESERIVAAAEQEIDAAATHARRGLRQFAADLAIDQATRQLTLSPETDRALIHEFIGQVAGNAQGAGNAQVAGKGQAANGQVVAAGEGGKK